jgi:hypothetical protein
MTSPYVYSTATVTEKSRSGTSVVLNVKIVTHLNTSSSFVGNGYKFTGTVTAYGISKSFTLKESGSSWSGNADHTVSGTMSITVPATVTSITVGYKMAVSGLESGSKTGTSKSLTLSKVLASVTSATNFSDTTNPTVKFSNPSKLKVRPYLNFYDKTGGTLLLTLFPPTTSVSSTGAVLTSSYTWDLNAEYSDGLTYRNKIRNILGTKTSAYVAVGLNTYSGSTKLGYSSKGVTFTNVLEPPIFNNFSFENVDEKTLNLTGQNPQLFISNYSTLKITISEPDKAVANKGATMSHYLINGVKYPYSETFEQEIANWNKTSVEIYAVDSRGLTTKKDLPCELISYTPLKKGNITIKREGGVGEKTTLFYEGSIWNNWFSGEKDKGVENKIKSVKYTYQIGTGDIIVGETDITPTVTENSFSFENEIKGDTTTGFDISPIYNLVVTLEDELSSIEYTTLVPSGIPALAVYKNNVALHGKYDEELGGSQIYGDLFLNGIKMAEPNYIQFYKTADEETYNASYNYFAPFNGDDEITEGVSLGEGLKITKKSLTFGDRDIASSTWGIEVGKGVKCIFASVGVRYGNPNSSEVAISTFFYRNRKGTNVIYGSIADTITKPRYTGVLNYLIPVEEGDFVYVVGYRSVKSVDINVMSANASTSFRAFAIG